MQLLPKLEPIQVNVGVGVNVAAQTRVTQALLTEGQGQPLPVTAMLRHLDEIPVPPLNGSQPKELVHVDAG